MSSASRDRAGHVLGLRRHTVGLRPHHPEWLARATRLIDDIVGATGLPRHRVQHVGSTAVPGLAAKPILDFDVGLLEADDVGRVVAALVGLGFIDRGDKGGGIGRLLVLESEPDVRTAHVHVVDFASDGWRQDLAFRDALRSDNELRERYEALKTDLASRHPGSRAEYRHAKRPFIAAALAELHRISDDA